ncbi:MAG: hypothetical protein R3F30_15345 [Planctomycetota bacterium]
MFGTLLLLSSLGSLAVADDPLALETVRLDTTGAAPIAADPEAGSLADLVAALRFGADPAVQRKPDERVGDIQDPFHFAQWGGAQFEHTTLADGEGTISGIRLIAALPIQEKHLVRVELPLLSTDLSGTGREAGVGDIRLRYTYMASRNEDKEKLVEGVLPFAELILPSGDEDEGMGFGTTQLDFGATAPMRVGETVSVVPIVTWMHSFGGVRPAGNTDLNLPGAHEGADTRIDHQTRVLRTQIRTVLRDPEAIWLDWLTIDVDLAWNFSDPMARSYRLQFEAGKMLKKDFGAQAMLALPIGGDETIGYRFAVLGILYL